MVKRCWWEFKGWNWIYHKKQWTLAENKIKIEIKQLLLKYKYGNNIHKHRKHPKDEPHKFVLSSSQWLGLGILDKDVALQSLPIYYTWKK